MDLFHDPAMEQFFTRGIRGGQSFIATRHAAGQADSKASGEHLLYVDGNILSLSVKKVWLKLRYISANNLYGSMETRMLPVGNFKWVT